ncbi:hypothetical protein KBC75_04010 [Candidatus Shapirobacteria bacterium]|nr:hypothetical protein [Candidatus Shapirobacteria bacterium]
MKIKEKFTTITTFSKFLALGIFVALPFMGIYLGSKYQKMITVQTVCPVCLEKPQQQPLAIKPTVTTKLSGVFQSDNYGYRVTVPDGWVAELKPQFDNNLEVYSPDLLIWNEGYGSPIVGAQITVMVKNSDFLNLDEYLKDRTERDKSMYLNSRFIKVDNIRAVQYENGWEGYGTTTVFFKNGKEYDIFMTYNYDQKSTQQYIDVYNKMLKTFIIGTIK